MKRNLKTIIGTAAFSALAFNASAQVAGEPATPATASPAQTQNPAQAATPEAAKPNNREPEATAGSRGLIGAAKAGDLIGMEVVNRQEVKVGSVHEIAVDIESGRIVEVILATGGFLGIGDSETAVPPGALVLNTEKRQLRLDAGKEQLLGAPPFDSSKWSEAFTKERLTAVYKHFGMESSLDFVDAADQAGTPVSIPESRLDGIQRASQIVGMKVANLQNDAVGDVKEILLDLSAGRLVALVVTTGEFLGIEGELSAIPAASFRFSTDRTTLHVDTSKAALEAAPHFKADRWPDFTSAATTGALFAAYAVEPYFRDDAATNTRPARTEAPESNDPASQSGALADLKTTSEIRKEINALANVSANARSVSVVTSNGQTTLRGPVETAEEKVIIGEIAKRHNRQTEVENLLVVKVAIPRSE
jgi:sporulation protein YlmC with PRC-barrel domain